MTVADRLGYDVGIDKQRKKAQKKSEGQSEGESMAQGDGDGSGTGGKEEGSGEGTEVDEKKQLSVNIDMLEGILKVQKERLEELDKN